MTTKEFIEQNKSRILDELFGLIRIPSISALSENKSDMYRAAEYAKDILLKAGADKAQVMETTGNPVVYGEKIIDKTKPTILVYGHLDVMPVDPIELWKTNPFEPVIKDGKIYARGADDDKGQLFMHFKAFEYMIATNTLPCNVKFLLEGEEEVGSSSLPKFCTENKELLKTDVILVSDTTMIAKDIPSVTTGLRGLTYMEVELVGPNHDLHSGLFGGAVANPANVLCKMIASLIDDNGHITVKDFYKNVLEVSAEERVLMAKRPFNEEEYKKAIDVEELQGEKGFSTIERIGIRPTLDVNGIWSGYTQEGSKTVLPSKANAKISMRLVPNQTSKEIAQVFQKHFESISPKSVKVTVKECHGGEPYVCPIDNKAYKAAERAYLETFGKQPLPTRSGGSIPIISTFEQILGIKSVLMGFGLDADAIHSPNESFELECFFKGIETIPLFYKYYAQ